MANINLDVSKGPLGPFKKKKEMPKLSEIITRRLRNRNKPFAANDNVASSLLPGELEFLEEEVAENVAVLLRSLLIDIDNDHNTKGTPKRVAKMFLREVFKGRYQNAPTITDFPNIRKLDEMYVSGPITLRSACSHHLVPIMGRVWIGVIPRDRIIGLSKFNRIVEWIGARPQIQEELIVQIADHLESVIDPLGLGVVVEATHFCMTWRGVREPRTSAMVNSVMRGIFREKPDVKGEFLSFVKGIK